MEKFIKVAAGVLVALVLYLILNKQGKDFAVLISLGVCCMVVSAVLAFFRPLITFIEKLEQLGNFDSGILQILLKSVGIGILTEIVSLICADAGNASMGKSLQILASVVILWLSIPLFSDLMDMIQEILVAL